MTNQKVIRYQLERFGHSAKVVNNGREALTAMESGTYDIVLMDCQMPELDGYATTEEIRRRENGGGHTWIVAVTAHAMTGDRAKCFAAGMDDYVAKPVSILAMRQALERCERRTDASKRAITEPRLA